MRCFRCPMAVDEVQRSAGRLYTRNLRPPILPASSSPLKGTVALQAASYQQLTYSTSAWILLHQFHVGTNSQHQPAGCLSYTFQHVSPVYPTPCMQNVLSLAHLLSWESMRSLEVSDRNFDMIFPIHIWGVLESTSQPPTPNPPTPNNSKWTN